MLKQINENAELGPELQACIQNTVDTMNWVLKRYGSKLRAKVVKHV